VQSLHSLGMLGLTRPISLGLAPCHIEHLKARDGSCPGNLIHENLSDVAVDCKFYVQPVGDLIVGCNSLSVVTAVSQTCPVEPRETPS
jgi:hypothetical protein